MRRRPGIRRTLAAIACILALTSGWSARALPRFRGPSVLIDPATGVILECPDFAEPTVELIRYTSLTGYPIVGWSVRVFGDAVKFHGQPFPACGFPEYVAPLPYYEWSLVAQPEGSTTVLLDSTAPSPRLWLDKAGTYVVRLEPCAHGCDVVPPGSHLPAIHVDPGDFDPIEVTFEAFDEAPLGPETTPAVVPSTNTGFSTPPDGQCGFGAGVFAKQWWAVEQVESPDNYKLLEGGVVQSRVSRKDVPWNHGSQDTNYHIKPDLKYSYLQFESDEPGDPGPNDPRPIEVEWERGLIPERYRPTAGDRASVFGFWVTDCGHGRPEIHPPVGIAVHRPRPIRIPDDKTFPELGNVIAGTGLYVPGVITDMYFDNRGGTLVDCDVDTGLANAERVPIPGLPGPGGPACVPAPSLNRLFKFDIYLPRNPQVTMRQAGFTTVPPVPLYIQPIDVVPGPQPPLTIERMTDPTGILTYLHVTLDLRGYTGTTYARRIVSGWVLPAADNWGLARYRLRLRQLNINDEDNGTWRLWVNTNNASSETFSTQEWVKIIDGGVENTEDFGNCPWETGLPGPSCAPAGARSLGPDLLRYPSPFSQHIPGPRDYGILFHTTGYENHTLEDDDAGTVLRSRLEPGTPYHLQNDCWPSEQAGGLLVSGCQHYTADVEVVPGPPLPPGVLSDEARELADQYVLRCGGPFCTGKFPGPLVAAPLEATPVDPLVVPLGLRAAARDFDGFDAFEPAEREAIAVTDITIGDFYRDVVAMLKTDRARLDRGLKNLHATFVARIADPAMAEEAILDAQVVRAALPPNLWARYFSDIPSPPMDPRGSKALFTGGGTVSSPKASVSLKAIVLHCDALRRPNSLSATWGSSRFDLDVVLRSACTRPPGARNKTRTQEGTGIGRFNGVPGASVRWKLVDNGANGEDTASITVWNGDAAPILDVSGPIKPGQIQGEGPAQSARAAAALTPSNGRRLLRRSR
jgi:hypothetical protein